jgi:hypothetical protein
LSGRLRSSSTASTDGHQDSPTERSHGNRPHLRGGSRRACGPASPSSPRWATCTTATCRCAGSRGSTATSS